MKDIVIFSVLILIGLNGILFSHSKETITIDGWFDSYGLIPWEEERLHLDNFAIYLERNSDSNGYIAFYVGEKDEAKEIEKRTARATNYLICERKIAKNRIIVVNAGKRQETKIVLQPVSKDKPTPDF